MKRRSLLKGFIGTVMGVAATPLLAKVKPIPETTASLPESSFEFTPDLETSSNGHHPIIISVVADSPFARDEISEAIKHQYGDDYSVYCFDSFSEFEKRCLAAFYPSVDTSILDKTEDDYRNIAYMKRAQNNHHALRLLRETRQPKKTVFVVADKPRGVLSNATITSPKLAYLKTSPSMRGILGSLAFHTDGDVFWQNPVSSERMVVRYNPLTYPIFKALNWV